MEGSPPAEPNSAAGGILPETDCVEGGMEQFSSNFSFLPPVMEGKKKLYGLWPAQVVVV